MIQNPGRVVSIKIETNDMASTTQPNIIAPVLAHDFRTSNPMPNKRPKTGAILIFPPGSTNQVLKYIGRIRVMPDKSNEQNTI